MLCCAPKFVALYIYTNFVHVQIRDRLESRKSDSLDKGRHRTDPRKARRPASGSLLPLLNWLTDLAGAACQCASAGGGLTDGTADCSLQKAARHPANGTEGCSSAARKCVLFLNRHTDTQRVRVWETCRVPHANVCLCHAAGASHSPAARKWGAWHIAMNTRP